MFLSDNVDDKALLGYGRDGGVVPEGRWEEAVGVVFIGGIGLLILSFHGDAIINYSISSLHGKNHTRWRNFSLRSRKSGFGLSSEVW